MAICQNTCRNQSSLSDDVTIEWVPPDYGLLFTKTAGFIE